MLLSTIVLLKMTSIDTVPFPPYYYDCIWFENLATNIKHNHGKKLHLDKTLCTEMSHSILLRGDGYPGCVHVENKIPYFV